MIGSSLDDPAIQAIRQWCALHKTDNHYDSNCRSQQESVPPDASKKRPTGAKKTSKPRRLHFKSSNDRKKFMHSIEEMEGVSFDDSSNEDDSEVVEQSLMQLHADFSSENSDDDESHSDLHVLVLQPGNMLEEADVIMTEENAPCTQTEKPSAPSQNDLSSVGSAVSHLSLNTSLSLREVIESSVGSPVLSDYAALSPSDVALLDSPDPEPSDSLLKIPKVQENPFTPDPLEMDTEMFPSLPSLADPVPPQATAPLPHGPALINGVYYQPLPPPHNVVAVTSSAPDPTLTTVTPSEVLASNGSVPQADKPKVGLEFAMPEQPPAKKTGRSSRTRSRSSSRTRSRHDRSNSRNCQARNQGKSSLEPPLTRSSLGRGRKRPDMPTTPIQVPASHSHLMAKSKPNRGLKITFATDTHERKVETTVQHLEQLGNKASAPLILTSKPSMDTSVQPEPPAQAQDDSDVDLETGEISIPTLPVNKTTALVYKTDATIEDYKTFATIMLQWESSIWDRDVVAFHPDLFYKSYFQDYQYLMDLRQKGNARIQSFNVKVTRQEAKP